MTPKEFRFIARRAIMFILAVAIFLTILKIIS